MRRGGIKVQQNIVGRGSFSPNKKTRNPSRGIKQLKYAIYTQLIYIYIGVNDEFLSDDDSKA